MNPSLLLAFAMASVPGTTPPVSPATLPSSSVSITYHKVDVDGVGMFYREAGPKDAPTIVLLHGFPSSSRMFDTLVPLLAPKYHLIAPDYPGFGNSDAPPPSQYTTPSIISLSRRMRCSRNSRSIVT